jgi:hypothetical protein
MIVSQPVRIFFHVYYIMYILIILLLNCYKVNRNSPIGHITNVLIFNIMFSIYVQFGPCALFVSSM